MPHVDPPDRSSEGLEEILDRFEAAWRQGTAPPLEDYVPPVGARRHRVLVELAHADLEFRLKAGLPARAEDYLARFPELDRDRDAVLGLIRAEYEFRRRREPELTAEEYLGRFPTYREELRAALPATTPGGTLGPAAPADTVVTSPSPTDTARPVAAPAGTAWPCVPGYEIVGELGRGAMGVVYKARQVGLNRLVALKMILHADYAGVEERRRFQAEAEAIARLRHPNIVQVYEVGEHEGLPFFSLEYCLEGSLDARLKGTPLPPREVTELIRALAEAVHAAHEAKVVHRDLKPANVLLASRVASAPAALPPGADVTRLADFEPKVTDFGLAKRLDESHQTASRAVLGTPSYMAPEQAQGKAREVGPQADVYSLGAILYECLTGRPPFVGADVLDVLLRVVSDEPVAVRALAPKTPRDLETICHKCLRKEPAQRYATAAALAEDLRRWQAGEPIAARPVGPLGRAVKWARRRPAVAALLTALVAGVALAFGALRQEQLRTAQERDRALEAEREANENFEQARRAVDESFGLAKVEPMLQGENLRSVRRLLLQKALPFYQSFTRRSPDDPELAARRADYLGRVGFITTEVGGKPEALEVYLQVRDIYLGLIKAHPDVFAHQLNLAQTYNHLGVLQMHLGKPREAMASQEEARKILLTLSASRPQDPKTASSLGNTYNDLGLLEGQVGMQQAALASHERAKDIVAKLVEAHPGEIAYLVQLGAIYNNLGLLQRQMGDHARAISHYLQARDALTRVLQAHPKVPSYQAELGSVYNNLGVAQRREGKPEDALASYKRAKEIRASLCEAFPDVTAYQADLANTCNNLGVLQRQTRRYEDALQSYQQGALLLTKLSKAHPNIAAYHADLARNLNNVGVLLTDTGKPAEALKNYEQAAVVLTRLTKAHPEVSRYQEAHASTYNNIGYLQVRMGDPEMARASFTQAISILQAAGKLSPDTQLLLPILRSAHTRRAQALLQLDQYRAAVADWDEVLRLTPSPSARTGPRVQRAVALANAGEYRLAAGEAEALAGAPSLSGEVLHYLAVANSLSAAAAFVDPARPLPEREKNAGAWASRAVELLRRAQVAGYFKTARNRDRARTNRLLNFLSGRDDFKAWLAELNEPGTK